LSNCGQNSSVCGPWRIRDRSGVGKHCPIENKHRILAVEADFRRKVPASQLAFEIAVHRMMPHPKIKQQNGQRMQIGFGGGIGFGKDHLGRHEFKRSLDLAFRLAVHAHIVVVADEHIARLRVEHEVAGRDVAVAVAAEMKRSISVGGLISDFAHGAGRGLGFAAPCTSPSSAKVRVSISGII
jgi:hypothetical protein